MSDEKDFDVVISGTRFDPAELEHSRDTADDDASAARDAKARYWIVQFQRSLDADDVDRLRGRFGLRLTDYVPNFTYLERLTPKTADELRSEGLVRAVAIFGDDLKLAPASKKRAADDDLPAALVNVVLYDDADERTVRSGLEDLGAQQITTFDLRERGGWLTVRCALPPKVVPQIAGLDDVRWIEPVPPVTDDDDRTLDASPAEAPAAAPKGIRRIWAAGIAGQGQTIGLIDNGPPDLRHSFFRAASGEMPGPTHRKVVMLRNARRQDPGAHATFVAGCAAGDDVRTPGLAPRRGWAWAAKLALGNRRDLAIFENPNENSATTLFIELSAAAEADAAIHSNSWHAKPQGAHLPAIYDLTAAEVDAFTWANEDHLVVGSSGNSPEEQGPPGSAKNALCISAAKLTGDGIGLGDGAAGPTADGRRKPDLMAVGCGIESAIVDTDSEVGPKEPCASSYATPLASAAAALARQYFMEGFHPSGTRQADDGFVPSGALLKAILLDGAIPPTDGTPNPGVRTGWGLLSLGRTLFFEGESRRLSIADVRHESGLRSGEIHRSSVRVTSAEEPLRATLVWTDPPGRPEAGLSTVNDLDLEVVSPTGDVLLGNVYQDGASATGGQADRLNNVETVSVISPPTGTWSIIIRAFEVNVGKPAQGFALVVSGALVA